MEIYLTEKMCFLELCPLKEIILKWKQIKKIKTKKVKEEGQNKRSKST